MKLLSQTSLPEDFPVAIDLDVVKVTVEFLTLRDDEGHMLAVVGLMLPNYLSEVAYLWAYVSERHWSFSELRECSRLGNEYLSSCPWTIYAEVLSTSEKNINFLIFFGFRPVAELDNRTLMVW